MKMCNFSVNFDAIRLKFGWRIAFETVHHCFKFQSGRTRNERRICVLNLCLEVARGQGPNPDPSGTAPDALLLSYQVLQGIAM